MTYPKQGNLEKGNRKTRRKIKATTIAVTAIITDAKKTNVFFKLTRSKLLIVRTI